MSEKKLYDGKMFDVQLFRELMINGGVIEIPRECEQIAKIEAHSFITMNFFDRPVIQPNFTLKII